MKQIKSSGLMKPRCCCC